VTTNPFRTEPKHRGEKPSIDPDGVERSRARHFTILESRFCPLHGPVGYAQYDAKHRRDIP
jgi:hypothetical protein